MKIWSRHIAMHCPKYERKNLKFPMIKSYQGCRRVRKIDGCMQFPSPGLKKLLKNLMHLSWFNFHSQSILQLKYLRKTKYKLHTNEKRESDTQSTYLSQQIISLQFLSIDLEQSRVFSITCIQNEFSVWIVLI